MESKMEIRRIILTGPESTGKSILTAELAKRFGAPFIPEYAREYILKLDRPYTYGDVIHIAQKQVQLIESYTELNPPYLFVDTYLIITKVWLYKVFSKLPGWIDDEIKKTSNDLYLLCCPDIPWEPDPVRENGGAMRQVLFDMYEDELRKSGLNHAYIQGEGENRVKNAIEKINNFYQKR
jgi:nicotinamide riboside kinase